MTVKETMAITMIDPFNVKATPFEKSHLLMKLKKAVICARLFESQEEKRSVPDYFSGRKPLSTSHTMRVTGQSGIFFESALATA